MKPFLFPLFLVAAVVAGGCAAEHAHYRRPEPQPVVVISRPPPVVVVRSISERDAIRIARAEAYRRGWRQAEIHRSGYWNDRWHVDLYSQPKGGREQNGWIEIAPDGSVVEYSEAPHHQAYWEGHPSRDYRRR